VIGHVLEVFDAENVPGKGHRDRHAGNAVGLISGQNRKDSLTTRHHCTFLLSGGSRAALEQQRSREQHR
jgi:hypothetical protein